MLFDDVYDFAFDIGEALIDQGRLGEPGRRRRELEPGELVRVCPRAASIKPDPQYIRMAPVTPVISIWTPITARISPMMRVTTFNPFLPSMAISRSPEMKNP